MNATWQWASANPDAAARRIRELERENAALLEDKERLDFGQIRIRQMDELGDFYWCIHKGMNLRAAIDAARKEASK